MGRPDSSPEQSLHESVVNRNVAAIQSLAKAGVGLESKNEDRMTPLMVACMDRNSHHVAKVLIESGAHVNAYRPESEGGTALHFAAKCGLEETVNLLLSSGANACIQNDDRHTAFEMARRNNNHAICRSIMIYIHYFSCFFIAEKYEKGNLSAEYSSPGSPKQFWIVAMPCSAPEAKKRPEMQLIIYATSVDDEPLDIIPLLKSKIKKLEFHQNSLEIVRKTSDTRYRFYPVKDEKEHLRRLYSACLGIPQVLPQTPPTAPQTSQSQNAVTGFNPLSPSAPEMDNIASVSSAAKTKPECSICYAAPLGGASIPCGHVACISCLENIKASNGVCPNCREDIKDILPLYM